MSKLDFYKIIARCDESYDGKFFYAVKTTGIFCRPSCKSKTPKKENIEFFYTAEECIKKGYRPCKRCKSDLLEYNYIQSKAQDIKNIIDNLFDDAESLEDKLKSINLSNKRITEIFKQQYNTTPSNYIAELRLKKAKIKLIETNATIIEIVFECGFNSLATFYRLFRLQENMTPSQYRNTSPLRDKKG